MPIPKCLFAQGCMSHPPAEPKYSWTFPGPQNGYDEAPHQQLPLHVVPFVETSFRSMAVEEKDDERLKAGSDWNDSFQINAQVTPAIPPPYTARASNTLGLADHGESLYPNRPSPSASPHCISSMHPELQRVPQYPSPLFGNGEFNINFSASRQGLPPLGAPELLQDAPPLQSNHSSGAVRRHRTIAPQPTPHPYSRDHIIPPQPRETSISNPSLGVGEAVTNYISLEPPSVQLASDHPDWRLTAEIYQWLFSVMYPKRRPDKSRATPSGQCLLCDTVCKRPGILQQHLLILHRQRLARKFRAGREYNHELVLAFVVAQIRSIPNRARTPLEDECDAFLAPLKVPPFFMDPVATDAFPLLSEKLREYSFEESWVGAQCQQCGMWATRPVALEEHMIVCVKSRLPTS